MIAVQYHYGKFPPEILDWEKLIPFVGPANASLARYDGVLSAIPNANILLSPLTTQEAVLSCGLKELRLRCVLSLAYSTQTRLCLINRKI